MGSATHLIVDAASTLLTLILAALALGRGSSLLFDLKQGSIGMCTARDAMAFNARPASEFLVVDEDHGRVLI